MVDLLALASRSTSHRPSCPKARRAMPRCGPVSGCPARCRHDAVTLPRTGPGHRSGAVRTAAPPSQLGWLAGGTGPTTTFLRPANRSGSRGGSVLTLPVPMPLTTTLPKRGPGPFSGDDHPKVTSTRLGSPVPVGAALSGTEDRLQDASPLVKGCFSIHRVLPRTSSLRTGMVGSSTVHAQRYPERRGPRRPERPGLNGCHAQRVRHVLASRWPARTRSCTLCPRDRADCCR
jgi:hypothetical protein